MLFERQEPMKRGYDYGTVAIVQPKRVQRSYVTLARAKNRGYYSTAKQRAAAAYGRPGLLGIRPGYTTTSGFYGRFNKGAGMARELKFFDTALTITIDSTMEISSSAATGQVALIPQNDTESGRDGRVCSIKSIYMKGNMFFAPGAGANATAKVFIWIIQDTQANGAVPTQAEVFTGTDASSALHNLSNNQRFKVLGRITREFQAQAGVTTAYNAVVHCFEFYKKLNFVMNFNAAAGAITEIRSNNIFLAYGSVVADDLITLTGNCRLRFSD